MDFFDIYDGFVIEEENNIFNYFNSPLRKQRVLRERPEHFLEWEDADFKRRFRLQKDSVQYLLSLVEDKIKHKTERNQCASPMTQLLVALRFYATGSFYITIGDFSGLNASTICNIVKRVTRAIASLRPEFVRLPTNEEEILKLQQEFYEIARLPRVVGAIDCTHVRINSLDGDTAENFRNRKGYFSINVQAMCTSNLKIQDIVARWPGSTHDSLIFSNSALKYHFDNDSFGNGVLIGDSGYFLNHYLLTPYNNPQTPAQRLYNESHIRSRNVIERCFGVWKRRFPVLCIGMRCKLPLVQDVITASAVLHNLAIARNEEEPPVDPEVHVESDEIFEQIEADSTRHHETRDVLLEYFEFLI